jgi:hypothetical protein
MYRRSLFSALFLGLVSALPAPSPAADQKAAKSDKPGVVVRFASLDHLRADFLYLAEVVGEGEKAKQLEGIIKSKLGDKGLEGIDNMKAIGAYGWIGGFGIDSRVVLLLPIADRKAFLDLLSNTLDAKPDKGEDDVYTLNADKVQAPIYLRFAHDYAYVTVRDKDLLDADGLLAPAVVLPPGRNDTLSLTVDVGQIPDNLKELALGAIENRLAEIKEAELPHHGEAAKKFRDAAVDEVGARLKSLFNHGGETALHLHLDREGGDMALTLRVAGKPDSSLAHTIRDLGQVKSLTAALPRPHSAFMGELNVSLPEKLRKLLEPVLQEGEKHALDHAKDAGQRHVLNTVLPSIMPTLKAAEIDTAFDLQGPDADGLYQLIAGLKVKDGAQLEKTFRKTFAQDAKLVKLDVAKVGSVAIHRVTPERVDAGTRRAFGTNPLYVAFRADAVFLAMGDKGLDAIKQAAAIEPANGKVMELQVAIARLAPLSDDKKAVEIARAVFRERKDDDRLHVTLEGGKALTLRLSVKAKLLDYINRIEKAKKQ